ncbi:MAG: DNA polymerase III subunit gamma/tau [Pyrinomonadaceae bacterium]
MSYQVIARKWRPQAFDEVTGQEHITQTLRNALEFDRLHHAYLFAGARGVGKTTTARLLAKALNCHKTDKPNLNPCKSTDPDPCPSCVEIGESRSIDVLEFDAASNTQVDKIREIILENINITPARDRYRVFIIDEVHMLSTSSFNALLKTVEEPPPNVVFIMATTELHKVPETITSRCQEFMFRTIPQPKIFDRLKMIAEAENVDVSDAALRELARSGEGSMRDAQSNFDQVISFSKDKIDVPDVTRALGMAGRDVLVRSIQAIADKDPKTQLDVVEHLISEGHDLRNFCRDLLSVIRDLMVFKVAGNAEVLLDAAMLEPAETEQLAAHFSESDLLRFFNCVAETETKLKDSTQPRYMLELGLVRLVEMRRLTPVDKILERLAALESKYGIAPEIPIESLLAEAATAEKKTLIPETAEPFPVFSGPVEPDEPFFSEPPPEMFDDEPPEITSAPAPYDLSFIEELPERPVEIAPDRLEHYEHSTLDDAYENELYFDGEDLIPISAANQFAAGFSSVEPQAAAVSASTGGTAQAFKAPVFEPENEPDDIEIPALSDNPTDEELLTYAEHHPLIRKVKRVFRAKIVEVRRSE